MAERKGFEPSIPSPVYSLSRGAPSTTRPPLRRRSSRRNRPICATPSQRCFRRRSREIGTLDCAAAGSAGQGARLVTGTPSERGPSKWLIANLPGLAGVPYRVPRIARRGTAGASRRARMPRHHGTEKAEGQPLDSDRLGKCFERLADARDRKVQERPRGPSVPRRRRGKECAEGDITAAAVMADQAKPSRAATAGVSRSPCGPCGPHSVRPGRPSERPRPEPCG